MKIQGSTVLLTGANGGTGSAFLEERLKRGVGKLYVGVRSLEGDPTPQS